MDPQPLNWPNRVEYAVLSDIGLRRSNNQDSQAVMVAASPAAWQQRGDLFMVADGMGAHAAGELASKLATDTVPLVYYKLADRPPPEAALAAVEEANNQIHNRGQASPDFKGMGTTCTTLILLPQGAMAAHVGDSRAYRLRANRLEQLTFDHSLVWEMQRSGQIPAGQVPEYIPKNVITRSLGPNAAVQVDLEGPFPIAPGDTFLLCSDGLSGPVKDEEIGMILGCLPPAEAIRALIDLANLRGGPDNITAVVARAAAGPWAADASDSSAMRTGNRRPIHPAVWIVVGVLALAGVGLFAIQPLAALATLIVAALVLCGAMIFRGNAGTSGFRFDGSRLGRGPYTATACVPNADFVARIAGIVGDLRAAASREDWGVDWSQFNRLIEQAAAANRTSDFTVAIGQYCRAASFMLAELKRQGRGKNQLPT